MDAVTWPYVIYAGTAVTLTVVLAYTLHNNGKVFLAELFPDNVPVAKAINSLLVTGFFMLNLGYGFLISRTEPAATTFEATEGLIQRLGILLVSLGVIHFVNMGVLWKIRRNLKETGTLPIAPDAFVPPPPGPNDRVWAATAG